MIALVTGGTGFVGRYLIRELCNNGYKVRLLALPGEDTDVWEQDQVSIFRGDVRIPETLTAPMRDSDFVFHLAAVHGLWRPEQEYYSINLHGTENVCRAALAAQVRRLVHVSSWVVYGMGFREPVSEDFPLRPVSDHYAVTKAKADLVVQDFMRNGLRATVLRPGTMFGPGDTVNFKRLADRARTGKAVIIGSGRNLIPFVYVTDAVRAMIASAELEPAAGQCYNIGNDQALTQVELWNAIAEAIGSSPPRMRLPYFALYCLAGIAEFGFALYKSRGQPLVTRLGIKLYGSNNAHSLAKARTQLGYEPAVSIRDGVKKTAEWYLRATEAVSDDALDRIETHA